MTTKKNKAKKANTKKAVRKYIQGDVILREIDSLPEDAVRIAPEQSEKKGLILQQSEVTGHHHHFKPTAKVDLYQRPVKQKDGTTTITPDDGKLLVFQTAEELFHGREYKQKPAKDGSGEHESFVIPAKTMTEVLITREYDYDRMEVTKVVD